MLLQIRDYISREGLVNTQQLTREFRMDLSALQPLLDLWVNHGVIQKYQREEQKINCQSTCPRCPTQGPEYYTLRT